MKTASKKLQQAAIDTLAKYRDSVDKVPVRVQQRFYDKAKQAFDKLVAAMECKPPEALMVHETLASIVARIPQKVLTPGKDY